MSNFRSSIEKAEAERARKKEEEKLREKQREIDKQRQEEINRHTLDIRIQQAETHFNTVIMPIFRDIAAAKKIDINSNPYAVFVKPSFGLLGLEFVDWLIADKVREKSYPQHSGFVKESYPRHWGFAEDRDIVAKGKLIWDVVPDYRWSYLEMGITHNGFVIANFYPKENILIESNLRKFLLKVEEKIVNNTCDSDYVPEPQSP